MKAKRPKADEITLRDSETRRLYQEYRHLNDLKWNAPVVPIEVPYQRGWSRSFVLNKKYERRPDVAALEFLLPHLNETQFCRNGNFLHLDSKLKKIVPRGFELKQVTEARWRKEKIPEQYWKYFHLHHYTLFPLPRKVFAFTNSYLFEVEVSPHIITHRRLLLPEVERRLGEIEGFLFQPQITGRRLRLEGSNSGYWKSRYWKQRAHHRKNARDEIDAGLQDWEYEIEEKGQRKRWPFSFSPPVALISGL